MQEVVLMPHSPRRVHWAVALEEEEGRILTTYDDPTEPLTCCERCTYFTLVGCAGTFLILVVVMICYGAWYASKAARN
jgi:hypothetical protein